MPTVYLADRDPSFRKALAHSLRQDGVDVLTFDSGFDLYAQAIEQAPDLIVMDNDLKEMNGFEVFGRLKRRRGCLPPVVFVAHFNNRGLVERILDRGALDFLQRNRPQEEILDAIRRHLRGLPELPIAATAAQPVTSPVQLMASVAQPVASPAQPVASPVQPVASPARQLTTPAQPVTSLVQSPTAGAASGLLRRTRDRGAVATGLVRRAGDTMAVSAAEWRRVAVTGARIVRGAGDLLVLALTCLVAEIQAASAAVVAGAGARMQRAGSLLTVMAGRALRRTATAFVRLAEGILEIARATATRLAGQARAVGGSASRFGSRIAGFSILLVRRARAALAQAGTVYVASAPPGRQDGVASFRRLELNVHEHVPAWRTALAVHRRPLLNGAGSLAIAAGIIVLLLTDRHREPQVVILTELSGGGDAGLRAVESTSTRQWTEEELDREAAREAASALTGDPPNAADQLERGGEAPKGTAPRTSRPKVYTTPNADLLTAIQASSREPAAAVMPRTSQPRRRPKPSANRDDHVAAALPFGPLGQRNEPVWSQSFRVAGGAPLQLGMIDEHRDGVPEAGPPVPVKAGRPGAAD